MLRSTLQASSNQNMALIVLSWSPRSDRIAHANKEFITIKTLTTSSANAAGNKSWKAHDAAILCLDWSRDRIVSGGEDFRVKIWDEFGRCIFASALGSSLLDIQSPVTRVAWSPDATKIAVGTFDHLFLLDSNGYYLTSRNLGKWQQSCMRLIYN